MKLILAAGFIGLATVLLLVATAPATTQDPQPVTIRIEGPATPVSQGQTFTVYVYADNASNLGGFEFDLVFDSSVASAGAAQIALGEFLGSSGRNTGALRLGASQETPGRASFGAYSYGTRDGPTGSGVIAAVQMTASGPGTSTLTMENVLVTDASAALLDAVVQEGSVVVAGSLASATPTATATPSATPTATATPSVTPTATPSATPTATATPLGIPTVPPLVYDFNGDGRIDVADVVIIASCWSDAAGETCPETLDVDGDGDIDIADIMIVGGIVN